jgi:hypothetical protein
MIQNIGNESWLLITTEMELSEVVYLNLNSMKGGEVVYSIKHILVGIQMLTYLDRSVPWTDITFNLFSSRTEVAQPLYYITSHYYFLLFTELVLT